MGPRWSWRRLGGERRALRLGPELRGAAPDRRAGRRAAGALAPALVLARAVLDSFDGLRFEERAPGARSARAGAQVDVEPRPAGAVTNVQVETAALDEPYLVGAGEPVSFQVPESTGGGTIDANGVLRVLRAPSSGTTYRVSAVIADPTRDRLRHASAGVPAPADDELDATPFAGEPPLPPFGDPRHAAAVGASLAHRPAWRAAYAWAVRATAGARDAVRRRAHARGEAPRRAIPTTVRRRFRAPIATHSRTGSPPARPATARCSRPR